MRTPGQDQPGERRVANNPSAPRTHITCCPQCDNSTTGTSNGRRARLCLARSTLDAHQEYHQLVAPRCVLNCETAFSFCEGRHFFPRRELTLPPIPKRLPVEREGRRLTFAARRCQHCGKSYRPRNGNSNYCSNECSRKARASREKARRDAKRAGDQK